MLSNPRPRVLCVDDDEDSRMMLITLLGLELIDVEAVETVNELVGSIRQLVSEVESVTAKVIPFRRKMSFPSPFTFEPAAA